MISFPEAPPGSTASRTVTLTPGTWRLFCTLPGHAQLGMEATVTVS